MEFLIDDFSTSEANLHMDALVDKFNYLSTTICCCCFNRFADVLLTKYHTRNRYLFEDMLLCDECCYEQKARRDDGCILEETRLDDLTLVDTKDTFKVVLKRR